VIQGTEDAYGTLEQVRRTRAGIGAASQELILEGAGHSPHRDRPERVVEAASQFIRMIQ
jgi:pimeloyl-ACP methyl ester carboxylesterase